MKKYFIIISILIIIITAATAYKHFRKNKFSSLKIEAGLLKFAPEDSLLLMRIKNAELTARKFYQSKFYQSYFFNTEDSKIYENQKVKKFTESINSLELIAVLLLEDLLFTFGL